MIRLFSPSDTTFETNGDKIIHPFSAKVRKEDNGEFFLRMETDLSYIGDLIEGRIIVAPTPQGDQAFRIHNIEKTKNKISLQARHLFYDSENYLIEDSFVVDRNCNDALDHLNSATEPSSPFITLSNVGTVNSYRCVRKSLYEAVETVLERWGGHLVRDNWNLRIMDSIGQDNGVTIRYAKNLREITCSENWDEVVTKLLPVGYEGIMLNSLDPDADPYVYASISYDIPYTKTVSFQQNIDREEYGTEAAYKQALIDDLLHQAQDYLEVNSIPQVNYTLRANLEKITDVGDTVEVIDERLGINLLTNVIAFDYDCILGKYIEVEFGNFKKTLSGLIPTVNAYADKVSDEKSETVRITLSDELHQATAQILGMMGNSYVIYDGDKILVVDSRPKETAVNCIMINSGGIGFSNTGINGTFNSAWTIDGTLNMGAINVINLVADLIKGGTLRLGSQDNVSGVLELYDNTNNLIGEMTKDGLKMYGTDGSYVLMNSAVGFSGYDRNGTRIYWADRDEFHMRKSVVEEEITLCNSIRFIPITIMNGSTVVNEGVGIVSIIGQS